MEELIQATYTEISQTLNQIYEKRKRVLVFQKLVWVITGIYFLLLLVMLSVNYFPKIKNGLPPFIEQFLPSASNPYATMYPIIIGLMVLLYFATGYFTRAFQNFKISEAKTIAKMVGMLFPTVDFAQNVLAPKQEIVNSKLFSWLNKENPIYSYGQIRAKNDHTLINIADIGIVEPNITNKFLTTLLSIPGLNIIAVLYQYVVRNVITNKVADNVHFTFRGMFCWLRFKKKLKGHTVILTNNQTEKINRFFSANFKEEQRIQLEDPRFTNQFIVYSTDQTEARYVLSLAFMEKIVQLKEKFNQPILLSFQNQQMYLAVQNKHGLFSFPSGRLDKKTVEELGHDINTALHYK